MLVMRVVVVHPYAEFEVCRPYRFKDVADYRTWP